jgi:DNA-3-methyladenine glycosylase
VLIRALEPLAGLELMRERRGGLPDRQFCSGPGKLTIALGIELDLNQSSLVQGPVRVHPRPPEWRRGEIDTDRRIGITKAAELPWRFTARGSRWLSRPLARG